MPTYREVDSKEKEIQSYVNYRFKDEDIDFIVKEKKRFIKDKDNIVETKIDLLKKREEAEQRGEVELVKEIDAKIAELDEKADENNRKRSGNFNILA